MKTDPAAASWVFLLLPLWQEPTVGLSVSPAWGFLQRARYDPAFKYTLTGYPNGVWVGIPFMAEWPKEQFIPPYVPRFRNGWEPPLLSFMGAPKEQELNQLAESVANVAEQQRKQEMKRLSAEVGKGLLVP
ncbi:UNVERIFIED_CONTAM: Epidermal growth factor receptor kinase substrate 8 [Gekko kuhli]